MYIDRTQSTYTYLHVYHNNFHTTDLHVYMCFLTYVVGFDFEPVHGRFVFSPTEGSKRYLSQYVEIPIIDDYVKEPAEMFHMVFYDAQKVNSSHVNSISVLDDDEEGVCTLVCSTGQLL